MAVAYTLQCEMVIDSLFRWPFWARFLPELGLLTTAAHLFGSACDDRQQFSCRGWRLDIEDASSRTLLAISLDPIVR
jgi:hypothetical protein